jgi:hypothetical protein
LLAHIELVLAEQFDDVVVIGEQAPPLATERRQIAVLVVVELP